MSPLRKTLIVCALLGGAVCAAIPFLRSPSPQNAARQPEADEPLQLRGIDTEANPQSPASAEGKATPVAAVEPLSHDETEFPAVSSLPTLGQIGPPPQLETGFPQELQPVLPAGDGAEAIVAQGGDSVAVAPRRSHVIRDGDTLESLAQRYLGSANRSDEIFAANRNVLPQRDVLPIGVEIVIPVQSASP